MHSVRGLVCRGAALWVLLFVASVNVVSAQSALPAPWASRDIGSPLISGAATYYAPSTVMLRASGADVWGTSDQFHYAYVEVTGNVDVRARVDAIDPTSTWAKTGVMIRGSLTADAAHAFALVSYSKGIAFQRRPSSGALSVHTAGELAGAPRWVRLVRLGNSITAYSSVDGTTWSTIGSDTIQLGATAYVGLAATSRNVFAAGTSTLSQVAMSIPSTLPEGQSSADIGSPALNGSASYSNGTYTITAAGTDIWGTSDQFHYVYQQASGDIDVKVRIASIAYADRWSKAGVMIRASLGAESAHAMALTSARRGYAFQRRNTDGGVSAGTSGSAAAPPGWVRLKRSGDLVTAYQSTDGVTWTTIGSDSIALGDQVYVGIAATSHIATATTTVKADSFSVVQTAPANQPPTVSLATGGTAFTAPASVPLTASASDADGTVARVEFYSGSTLLGTDTAAPYAFTWSNVAAGTYSVRAVAYDDDGASAGSATATLTVSAASNPVPTVSLTAPAGGASYTAPASMSLSATAADANGVARVEFYAGSTLLGTDTTAPYSFTWSGVAAGSYALKAIAYDTLGAAGTSATVSVTVSAPASSTTKVAFTTSAADAALATSYVLEFFSAGSNPATATPVRTQSLGKPALDATGTATVDITSVFGALPAGSYVATVSAVWTGGVARSTGVAVTK